MEEVLKRVGRYDLLEVIGRGGAAVVYLALQRDLERRVALKELAPHHAETDFAGRFVEESRVAGSLSHANVVTVHEFFEEDGVPYIAMEYLPHGSLRQYVGRLSMAQIAGVLEGVLAGLSHGESHGIVHRDLKPENLLVAADGRVKIADFGVARAYNRATRAVVTVAGTTIGTPAYMSPEQALGGELTAATDLYSLGIVTYELLAGHVPFEETDTPVAVLYRHVHEPVPPVREQAPGVDVGVAAWLGRILAKRPEERFHTADAAWEELEDVVLDLLGPRWRREARLVVDDATAAAPKTLTPAAFRRQEPDPEPIAETNADLPVGAPMTTIAPTRRPRRSNTTLLRVARRHGEADDAPPDRGETLRRRLAALVIVLAMAGAAVAGVLLATRGPSRQDRARAAAERAAEARAKAVSETNSRLVGIVASLQRSHGHAQSDMSAARTQTQQARAAGEFATAYTAAAAQVAPFVGKSPVADPLRLALTNAASAYGKLADAGRSGSSRRWNAADALAVSAEKAVGTEVARL